MLLFLRDFYVVYELCSASVVLYPSMHALNI
jgi:hypothetical protein